MCVTQFVREHGTVRYEPGYIADFLFFGAFFYTSNISLELTESLYEPNGID